jgi:hypothetical protein
MQSCFFEVARCACQRAAPPRRPRCEDVRSAAVTRVCSAVTSTDATMVSVCSLSQCREDVRSVLDKMVQCKCFDWYLYILVELLSYTYLLLQENCHHSSISCVMLLRAYGP